MLNAVSTSDSEKSSIIIATRGSTLALFQAEWVQKRIIDEFPEISVELLIVKTTGDRIQDRPLSEIGGKNLFVKELENALLEGRADLAVHSMKDVTGFLPHGLEIPVILDREDPRDAWICPKFGSIKNIPSNAVVGTSSLRRASQLKYHRPDLTVKSLRGNVQTRLRKLDQGEIDAVILAVSGLKRIKLERRISEVLPVEWMLPAIGQGAIGIETRKGDEFSLSRIQHLNDPLTWDCLLAERSLLVELEGNCKLPLAGYSIINREELYLRAVIGDPEGKVQLRHGASAPRKNALELGKDVAKWLMKNGGKQILRRTPT